MRIRTFQFLTFIFFAFMSRQMLFSQIGNTRDEIIKDEGYNYESGITDNGIKYISYKEKFNTEQSGSFTRHKAIYFKTFDDGEELCHFWVTICPSTETNFLVAFYKKNMVEIGYMKWKDYETNILYEIEVDDGLCITTASYDFDKQ